MTTATETPQGLMPTPKVGAGCGSCSYKFNPGTGCYDRDGTGGCSGGCRCAPMICGVGSQALQKLRPASAMSPTLAVSLSCFAAASEAEWLTLALVDLALQQHQQQKAASPNRWKTACIAMVMVSVLLAIGLAAALLYR